MKTCLKHMVPNTGSLLLIALMLLTQSAVAAPTSQQGAPPNEAIQPTNPAAINGPTSTIFSYQGQLANAAGAPIASATLPMTFKLYPVATAGTPCWSEDHTGGNAVNIQNGLFHVLLGQLTAIPLACLTGDAYLELAVNGETLSPRELLTNVAFAVEASTLAAGATTRGDATVAGHLIASQGATFGEAAPFAGEGGEIALAAGASGNEWRIDNFFGTLRFHHDGAAYFTIADNGDTRIGSNLLLAGTGNGAIALRRDGSRSLHLLPWGGAGYDLDQVCIGCGSAANLRVNGDLEINYGGAFGGGINVGGDARVNGTLRFPDNPGGGSGDSASIRYYAETGENTRLELKVENDADDDIYLSAPQVSVSGNLYTGGADFALGTARIVDGNPSGLPIIRTNGAALELRPPQDDVAGSGVKLYDGNSSHHIAFRIYGAAEMDARRDDGSTIPLILQPGGADTQLGGNLNMNGHSVSNCGALVEANLQTKEELAASRIDRFGEGDVLCWGMDQLELCVAANDRLVQAVADKDGRPIIIGAEKVKVLGPVQRGDILVASDVPGYAMVNNEPRSGSVIAQALESFGGERGVIKAMIRKW